MLVHSYLRNHYLHHGRRLLNAEADEDCSGEDTDLTYLGVGLNCLGSVCINLGTNIIKYSHIVEADRLEREQKSVLDSNARAGTKGGDSSLIKSSSGETGNGDAAPAGLRPPKKLKRLLSFQPAFSSKYYWRFGFLLFIIGNVLNFGSFSFAKQSLLAALGSIQFVTNVIFGKTVLKATVTNKIMIGTAIIVAGNVAIVVGTGNDGCSPTLTSEQLQDLYKETNYIVYMTVIAVTGMLALIVYKTMKRRPLPPMNLLGFCFVYSSAVVGTQSVTLFKSLSTMLRDSSSGDNQLDSWFFYVVLVAAVCVAVFWVNRMNLALKKFNALFIIPVLQVCWVMLSSIGGGIYYKEFDAYSDEEIGLYSGSMALIVFGTYLLAPDQPAPRAQLVKRRRSDESVDGTSSDSRQQSDVTVISTNQLRNRQVNNSGSPAGSVISMGSDRDITPLPRPRTRSRVESGMGMSLPCFHPTSRDAQVDLEEWDSEEDYQRFAWKERKELMVDIRSSRKDDDGEVDIEMGTIAEIPSRKEDDEGGESTDSPPETPAASLV